MIRDREESFIIFQFKDNVLEALKWRGRSNAEKEIEAFLSEEYQSLQEKDVIAGKIRTILRRIKYAKEKIILIISHQRVSSRYLKLPSRDRKEIEAIIHLQAAKTLPYPEQEIICGYQVVDTDKEGYSFVNLVLLHRDTVRQCLDILRDAGLKVEHVFLSTYGLAGLFSRLRPEELQEVLVVNLDFPNLETAVLNKGKIYFSRFTSLNKEEADCQEKLFKQIMDTQGLYLRQGSLGPIKKVFLIGAREDTGDFQAALAKKMLVPVEVLSPPEGVSGITTKAGVENFPARAWGLSGFVYRLPEESLDLLPPELKEAKLKVTAARQQLKLIVIAAFSAVLLALSLFRQIDNKKAYLGYLDKELAAVRPRADKLEVKSQRLNVYGNKNTERAEVLDFLSAIHKVIPAGIVLAGVKYDSQREEKFSLWGYSEKMELVVSYASALQGLDTFAGQEVKVKYATNKTAGENEVAQ